MEESRRHPVNPGRRWMHAVRIGTIGGMLILFGLTIANCAFGGLFEHDRRVLVGVELISFCFAGVLGLLTGFGAWRLALERERRLLGQCIRCGYDLRESASRCPECGKRFYRHKVPVHGGEPSDRR